MRRIAIVLIAVILCFYLVNFLILRNEVGDYSTTHLPAGMYTEIPPAYTILSSQGWSALPAELRNGDYPPLFRLTSCALIRLTGRSWMVITLFNNMVYLAMLLVFIFLLGEELQDAITGIISTALVAFYPLLYWMFIIGYPTDFALPGLLAMSYYFLVKSDGFRSAVWAALCALGCGWGLMMKDPFAAFFAGPLLYNLGGVFVAAKRRNFIPLRNFFIFLVIVMALTFPYYGYRLAYILNRPMGEAWGGPWYSCTNFRLHTVGLWENQMGLAYFLVFVVGLIRCIRYPAPGSIVPLGAWILLPNIMILCMPHWKTSRYLLPQLPALALISALGVRPLLRRRAVALVFAVAVCVLGVFQYYQFTSGKGYLYNRSIGPLNYFRGEFEPVNVMRSAGRQARDIRREIGQIAGKADKQHPIRYLLLPNDACDIDIDLETYFWFQHLNVSGGDLSLKGYSIDQIVNLDLILTIMRDDRPISGADIAEMVCRRQRGEPSVDMAKEWDRIVAAFPVVRTVPIEGGYLRIYAKRGFDTTHKS